MLLAGLTFYLQEDTLPRFRNAIRSALALSHARPLHPDPYYDSVQGLLINIREYSTTRKIGRGVAVSETYPNGLAKTQIDANQLEWISEPGSDEKDGHWVLHDGSMQRWDERGNLIVAERIAVELLDTMRSEGSVARIR